MAALRWGALALCRPVPVLAEAPVVVAGLAKPGLSAIYAGLGAAGGVGTFLLAVAAAFVLPGLTLLAVRGMGMMRVQRSPRR